jgi:hypothetical protein
MDSINPEVDLSILDEASEVQDIHITNPNMKTADAYIQALQETTMTLIDSILMLAGAWGAPAARRCDRTLPSSAPWRRCCRKGRLVAMLLLFRCLPFLGRP